MRAGTTDLSGDPKCRIIPLHDEAGPHTQMTACCRLGINADKAFPNRADPFPQRKARAEDMRSNPPTSNPTKPIEISTA